MTPPDTTAPDQVDTASEAKTFAELGLGDAMLKALKDVGYETPSAIQAATIPPLLAGRDVVGLAQTGTGKTAAFALPILSRLDLAQKNPQALVLAPTRELALQVCEAFEKYAAHMHGVHVLPVYGGQAYGVQLSALRRGVHIVVGTPGRIMDHLEKGTLDLSELKYLVLDEADEMLKMGFAEDVETILADTPDDKQVALFSATMPAQIRRISKKYLHDPEEITVENKTTTSANTTQRYLVVSYPQKVDALTRILEVENFEGMIVFVRTKNETETLAEKLRARGYSAAAISGDVAQAQRERASSTFSWPRMSRPAASTSSGSATSSTTTSRSTRSRTSTASAAPDVPAAAAPRSASSPRASVASSPRSRRRPASRSRRCSCPPSRT
jgi:ATP-dependent RNA helicase DeaD